ncbi:hypothetical protein D3C76_1649800 [compost metagenome]
MSCKHSYAALAQLEGIAVQANARTANTEHNSHQHWPQKLPGGHLQKTQPLTTGTGQQ